MQVLKDDIQEKILSSAKLLFLEYGFEKTTMEKISQKATISKSNLYNYFKSKDEIFNALTDHAATQFQNMITYFDKNQFSPKLGEAGFEDMLTEKIFGLISTQKDVLTLLMLHSAGTKHEYLKENLVKQISCKFIRDYNTHFANMEVLAKVIVSNLFDGITSITVHSNSEQQLKILLHSFIKYHSHGFLSLVHD